MVKTGAPLTQRRGSLSGKQGVQIVNKFVRRSDVVLLTDITRRLHSEIGGELREAVDLVYDRLCGAATYETEFWMLSSKGGIPEKLESTLTISRSPMTTTPADAICSFFNSSWWDDKAVARLEEMYERGGGG